MCAAGYTLGNRPSDDKVGDGSLRLAAPAGAPGAPGRHPRAAYDRPSLLASLLASVAVVAALTFTLTTQGALHGGGEATRESGAVDISAYLDNGGVPWHFEVVYSVMQYAKRAHSVRSFVMSDSFVAYSDRKALLAACMADETITLVPGIPTLRGKHPGNTNSAIGAFTAELCTHQLCKTNQKASADEYPIPMGRVQEGCRAAQAVSSGRKTQAFPGCLTSRWTSSSFSPSTRAPSPTTPLFATTHKHCCSCTALIRVPSRAGPTLST